MKSICVLDEKNSGTALPALARKLLAALGSRVVLMTDEAPQTLPFAAQLQNGFLQGGGTVLCLKSGFESRVVSAARQFAADGAVYLYYDSACRMSVYGAGGRRLTEEEERQIARAVPAPAAQTGVAAELKQNDAYTALAYELGGSLENVAASFASPNGSLLRFVKQTALTLGAVERKLPEFYLSRSGLTAAAQDELGRVYPHEMLLNLCCSCELSGKKTLEVPFASAFALAQTARSSGAGLRCSFDGGSEPWQTDGVLLVFRLLHHMSQSGLSLSSLFGSRTFPAQRRTILAFSGSLDRLADRIPCDEAIAQGDGLLFLRRKTAGAVLTRRKDGKRCCVEVQACDAETAQAVCDELEQAVLTYSNI